MAQNRDPSGPGNRGDLIDQITGAAEMLSFFLVAVPFGCMAALALIVLFSQADYVFLSGGILRLLLPAAIFALVVQL